MSWESTVKQFDAEAASTVLREFSTATAFELGLAARQRLMNKFPSKPVVVDVTLALGQVLFHGVTPVAGLSLDNDIWIARKVKTVLRFGCLSYFMGLKLKNKGKSLEQANFCLEVDYATHGGAVPIRITSFDGVVAVLTISGLAQEDDHRIAIESLKALREQQESS